MLLTDFRAGASSSTVGNQADTFSLWLSASLRLAILDANKTARTKRIKSPGRTFPRHGKRIFIFPAWKLRRRKKILFAKICSLFYMGRGEETLSFYHRTRTFSSFRSFQNLNFEGVPEFSIRTTNIISTRSSTTDLLETTFCMFVTFVSLESCARSRNRILLFRENSRNGETNCEIAE